MWCGHGCGCKGCGCVYVGVIVNSGCGSGCKGADVCMWV